MKNIIAGLTLFVSISLNGQHFYNDIIGTQQITSKMKAFVAARVQSVTATGYDAAGVKTSDFNEWQEVQENGTVLKITTRNGQNANRIYYRFDNKNRLINIRDSSRDIQSITEYIYNDKDLLTNIKTSSRDAGQDFNETEERQWHYNSKGKPEKMLRIVNGGDSTEYLFVPDEKGNVGEEKPTKRTLGIDPVYYYYDEKNRVSDIVRYDKHSKQLLPDVMFEYDDNDQIIQRITTLSTRPPDYLIFRFLFNDRGLKTKEAMYSKAQQLKGRIDYAYSFKQ